jgi:hypothetical protein
MENPQLLILVIMALIYLTPAALLLIAAIVVKKRMGGFSSVLIAIGAVMLGVTSVYALGNYYIATKGVAEDVAAFALKWGYMVTFFEFFGLIFIAIGLIGVSRKKQNISDTF